MSLPQFVNVRKVFFATKMSNSHMFVIVMHETDHVHPKWAQLAPLSIHYQASSTEELFHRHAART